ncbi:MBL fold metallo-hydrolase [Chengkuizengella sediminis]|uniref:MBL fold metallo-hydrolase n=1 Tax=Chengkuizengella sediminis TaxID=1885917 RepID=UPI00138A6A50|nr:MBL fold metallo-hydrolase [Chengkuizengella sediminis]NDI35348.1 MBL fold metallo-hydrolase [Chengkuizengella sediminis]
MNVVNIGYGSTNYYAIYCQNKYLLIDVGLPGTFGMMKNQLKKCGINLKDIHHLIITHFHPDHCGIAQEIQSSGVQIVISKTQLDFLESANKSMKKYPEYKEIIVNPKNILNENNKNTFFEKLGIPGYILHTPGHSDDSISIVIEGLGIFTGDLPLLYHVFSESDEKIELSWSKIRSTNEKKVFPGHGNSIELNSLS